VLALPSTAAKKRDANPFIVTIYLAVYFYQKPGNKPFPEILSGTYPTSQAFSARFSFITYLRKVSDFGSDIFLDGLQSDLVEQKVGFLRRSHVSTVWIKHRSSMDKYG
jgi:hypothetical protein